MHSPPLESIHHPILTELAAMHERKARPKRVNEMQEPVDDSLDEDTQLCESVKRKLRSGAYPMESIAVACSQGSIFLSGTVNSWHQKQMAQESVRHVPGTRRVVNQIEVVRDALPQK